MTVLSIPNRCLYTASLLACASFAQANDAATYAEASSLGMTSTITETITVGDLNGDDAPDVVSSPNFGQARYFLNNGTADSFLGVDGVAIDGAGMINGAALGDVNGDQHIDIVFRVFGGLNRIYLNNGNSLAPFAGVQGIDLSGDVDDTTDIELADMDGNGKLDVLVANTNISVNRLYLNNGTANPFENVSALDFGSTAGYWNEVSIADIDMDGDLDVAFANEISGFGATVEVFVNNGTDNPFAGVLPLELTNTLGFVSVQLADLTGDGLPDVAASESSNNRIRVFVNNGTPVPYMTGEFLSVTAESPRLGAITARDMNLDGDIDLVTGFYINSETQFVQVFLSNGTPDPFAGRIPTFVGPGQAYRNIAAEDMNSDSIPDIVVGSPIGLGPDRVYLGSLGPDTVAPFVGLLTPADGATVSGTVTLSAVAADNLGVASVEFLVDGLLVATLTEPPYDYDLDTTSFGNGMATIAAMAIDAGNNTATDTVSVLVDNVADADGDSIPDDFDNCLLVSNPLQRDTDGDGFGNFCDPDFDQNCSVDFFDVGIIKQNFLLVGDLATDLDGDGETSFPDLGIVKQYFLSVPGPSGWVPNGCAGIGPVGPR